MGAELQQTAAGSCCGSQTSQEVTTEITHQSQQSQKRQKKKSKTKSSSKRQKTNDNYTDNDDNNDDNKDNDTEHKTEPERERKYTITIEKYSPKKMGDDITNTFSYSAGKEMIESTYKTATDTIDYVSPYWTTLNEITSDDDIYYKKCVLLSDKIKSSINTPSIIQHDESDHANNWDYIESMAGLCQPALYEFLEHLVDSIKLFPSNDDKNDMNDQNDYESAEVIKASLKKLKRAKEKVDTNYNGNWLRLIDVCRSSIVHNNFKDLYFILLILAKYNQNCFGFEIVKIKNRYKKTTDQGWADITLLIKPIKTSQSMIINYDEIELQCTLNEEKVLQSIKMDNNNNNNNNNDNIHHGVDKNENTSLPGHICEVQLIHRSMWNKRKHGLFGHKTYGVTRSADSEAVKAANQIGGKPLGNIVNYAIDLRGDIIGKAGATMAVKNNRQEIGKNVGNTYTEIDQYINVNSN